MKVPVRKLLLFVLFVSLGFLIPAGPAAGQTPPDDPLLQEAKHYATTYDVEIGEALSRLRLQSAIGRLNAELGDKERATFAGLWVQHEPSYLIVVQFTGGGGAARLQKLLQRDEFHGLYPFVDVRTVKRSLRTLAAVQAASHRAAKAQGVPMESMINVRENRVDLRTTHVGPLNKSLQDADRMRKSALKLLDNTAIIEVDRLSTPARYVNGGHHLYFGANPECTSGFSVQDGSGRRGVITAGHCANGVSFNTRSLPFQSEAFSGSHDVQWHTSPAELHDVNRIWDGLFDTTTPYYRFITGSKPRAQQFVGEMVCKYGMTSGPTCGTISSTTFAPSYVPGAAATFIVVTSSTQDQSAPGDSGGPWYSGNTAYGIMSGQFTTNFDAIYMAIDYISVLGVDLLTTTPALDVGRFTFRNMGDDITAYTEIDANEYECGVAGIAARDGDILENNAGPILRSHLMTANNHFNFRGEFRTHNNHESWDFDLLCLKRSAYAVSRFQFNNLGDDVTYNTGLSTTAYECGVGGMAALDGDINENNSGNPILAYMFRSGGQWWLRGDFRTHNNSESWDLHALCVDRSYPVTRYEFRNLGDNVNGYNTFISSDTYECGVAGMAARDADIQENDTGDPILAYLFASGGTWRIRADFRTHNNHESWDIDVLCIQR